jgi:hypothetical protein
MARELREGKVDQVELDGLLAQWAELSEDFIRATASGCYRVSAGDCDHLHGGGRPPVAGKS